jgi:hypothetical protein
MIPPLSSPDESSRSAPVVESPAAGPSA